MTTKKTILTVESVIDTKETPDQQQQIMLNSSSPENNSHHLLSPPPRISTSSSSTSCDHSDCCYSGYSSSSADYASTGTDPTVAVEDTASTSSAAIVSATAATATATASVTNLNKSNSLSKKKVLYKSSNNDFGGGLLSQVQKMQSLLEEYQHSLTALEIEKADHQQELLKLDKRLKAKGESEERYKEEIWNLELCKQELIQKVQDLSTSLQRSNLEQARLQREQLDLEHIRVTWEQQIKEAQANYEQELMSYRKIIQNHRLEKENLSSQIRELALQVAAASSPVTTSALVLRPVPVKNETEAHGQQEKENIINSVPITSLTPVVSNISKRNSSISNASREIDALKASLNHAHEIIQTIQGKLDKERDERMQVDQLLRDAQETIENFHHSRSQNSCNSPRGWQTPSPPQQASSPISSSSNFLSPTSPLSSSYSAHSSSNSNNYRSRRSSSATNAVYQNSSKSCRKGRIFKVDATTSKRSSPYPVSKGGGISLCDELSQAGSIGNFSGMVIAPEVPLHIKVTNSEDKEHKMLVVEEKGETKAHQQDEEDIDETLSFSPQSNAQFSNNQASTVHGSEALPVNTAEPNIQHPGAAELKPISSLSASIKVSNPAAAREEMKPDNNSILKDPRKYTMLPASAHTDIKSYLRINSSSETIYQPMDKVDHQATANTKEEVRSVTSTITQPTLSLKKTSRNIKGPIITPPVTDSEIEISQTLVSPIRIASRPVLLTFVDLPSVSNHELYSSFTSTTNSSASGEPLSSEEKVEEEQHQVNMSPAIIGQHQQQQQNYGSLLKKESYIYKSRRQLLEEEQKKKKSDEKKCKEPFDLVAALTIIPEKRIEMQEQQDKKRSRESVDDGSVTALTKTMIGDWMWKYTRKVVGTGISENSRHRRFFWIHPYTQTLYWSSQEPGSFKNSQSTSTTKSVRVESFSVLGYDSRSNSKSNLLPSILIKTPSRGLKMQCMDLEAHDAWIKSLKLLLADNHGAAESNNRKESPKLSIFGSISKYHYLNRKKSRQQKETNKEVISISSFPLPLIIQNPNNDALSSPILLHQQHHPPVIASNDTILLNNSTLVDLSNLNGSKVVTTS